jgi:hypothetical protein
MSFLDYAGDYEEIDDSEKYAFTFKGNISRKFKPYLIVSPVFDVPFKKIFFCNDDGIDILKDFLNSILYPESNSIESLITLPKENLSVSSVKKNKCSLIVDTDYLATIQGQKIIINVEMYYNKFDESIIKKCFNYGTGLRNQNKFLTTWVIALCYNKFKDPLLDLGSKSFVKNEENDTGKFFDLGYIKIFEIHLNALYKNSLNAKSVVNEEKIGDKGREWIKLFCLHLWSKTAKKDDDIYFIIPDGLKYKSQGVSNAISILGDIQQKELFRLETELQEEKDREKEELVKQQSKFDEGYNEGYNFHFSKILDFYFNKFLNGQSIDDIVCLGKINISILKEKYSKHDKFEGFVKILADKNILEY